MTNDSVASLVTKSAAQFSIELTPEAASAFELYYRKLSQSGKRFNLTAITGIEDVARLHFVDSLSLLKVMDFKGAKVIDIGSGAGFPGLPLKIAEPTVDLTLLDATGKRVAFLSELTREMGLLVSCIQARAEDAAHKAEMREQYTIAVSRAVAELNILCELCLPFVCIGGTFLAMKSIDAEDEIAAAQSSMRALGAKLEGVRNYSIAGTDIKRSVAVIRKISPTPIAYPRRYARISKNPL